MGNQEKIQKVVKKIVKRFSPQKVILFGSYAWGKPSKDSDVDLLVIKNSKKRRMEREQELRKLLFPAGVAMDILVYTPQELEKAINEHQNLFLEDIVRNGRVLFAKPNSTIKILGGPAELLTI